MIIGRVLQRRTALFFAAAVLVISSFGVSAPTAHASTGYGYVYVSFPTWLGNCPYGGSVRGIYAANGYLWSTPPTGDWGDDLIYPKVLFYSNNPISFQNFCYRPWWQGGTYRAPAWQVTIYPTRYGQTFWIGPWGQRHNN